MDKKLFECKICGLKYKYRSNLSAHKKSHTGETQCPICKRNLSTIQMLQTHLALVHRKNFKHFITDAGNCIYFFNNWVLRLLNDLQIFIIILVKKKQKMLTGNASTGITSSTAAFKNI